MGCFVRRRANVIHGDHQGLHLLLNMIDTPDHLLHV